MGKISKTLISVLLSITMIVGLIPMTVITASAAGAGSWDGTADTSWFDSGEPFTIDTAEELAGLAKLVNEGKDFNGKIITLAADIDLLGHEWTPIGWYDVTKSDVYPFDGTFAGGGHKITGVTINTNTVMNAGLFGVLWNAAVVKDTAVINANVTSAYEGAQAGGLVAWGHGSIIENCNVQGAVICTKDTAYVGGIVGYSDHNAEDEEPKDPDKYCYIQDCSVTGTVTGGTLSCVGGITGNNYINISNCFASCAVTGGESAIVGGLAGCNTGGNINNCFATGVVEGKDSTVTSTYVGGFLGHTAGVISNCYATGNVTGGDASSAVASYTGGFAGYNESSILNCYALGNVSGGEGVPAHKALIGGFTGKNYGVIINCYTVGNVSGGASATLGGFTGGNAATLTNTYWNTSAEQKVNGAATTKLLFNGEDTTDINGLSGDVLKGAVPTTEITYLSSSGSLTTGTDAGAFLEALNGGIAALPSRSTYLGWKADSSVASAQLNKGYPFLYTKPTGLAILGAGRALTVQNGSTLQMTAKFEPTAAIDIVTWSITKGSEFASIDENTGILTAKGEGSVTVHAASVNTPSVSGEAVITVTSVPAPPVVIGGGNEIIPPSTTVETKDGATTASMDASVSYGSNGVASASVTESQITDALAKAAEEAKKQGTSSTEIEIKVNASGNPTGVSATIPRSAFNAAVSGGIDALTISSPTAKITFDETALTEIKQKGTGDINISSTRANVNDLPQVDKDKVGNRPVYDLTLTSGGTVISDFGGGTATVTVPYTLAAGEDPNKIVIYYISDSGEMIMVPDCVYESSTGMVTFKTKHFSKYSVGYNDVAFADVFDWSKDYVNYLSARGIISGMGDGTFNPESNITRAQFVTILAKLSGDDLNGNKSSPFSDIASSDWYFKAVQWAYENGVAKGTDGKFNPNGYITRQDIAVMIARYAEKVAKCTLPQTNSKVTFSDSAAIAAYASGAVTTMQQAGIITGSTDDSFAPTANATRAQVSKMVALLAQSII